MYVIFALSNQLLLIISIFFFTKGKKIKGGDSLEWKAKPMAVPPLPPTMDGKLIDIKYWVRIHLDVPMGIDMDFKLPVTIASVPFKTTYQDSPGERQSKYSKKICNTRLKKRR